MKFYSQWLETEHCSFLAVESLPRHNKGSKREVFQYKAKICMCGFEHAYGTLKRWWRIVYKKRECRKCNATSIIMACIALHNLCIKRHNPCLPHWQLKVKSLHLIRKPTKRTTDKKLF